MQNTIIKIFAVIVPLCFATLSLHASHIVGGGFTYKYLGDTITSGGTLHKYQVTMELYQDCTTGQAEAIAQDNPAFFTIYNTGSPIPVLVDSNVEYDQLSAVLLPVLYISACGASSSPQLPSVCLLKKVFKKTYYLPANTSGYIVVYQRASRNATIANIINSGDVGTTYFCNIPPTQNNSAVFKNYPPQIVCLNKSSVFDHSATDADGDSLTYELSPPYIGASDANIKPVTASPPPYDTVKYVPPSSWDNPIPAAIPMQIDAVTGKLSVTPNKAGRYLIAIACKEWRNGVLINTVRREFEWTVLDCDAFYNGYQPNAGPDQTITAGDSIHFNATGGASYLWAPSTFLSDPNIPNPVGHFTETGVFTYYLQATSDSGCTGGDKITISVIEHSDYAVPNAFTPNNDGHNDYLYPFPIGRSTLKSFDIFNRYGNHVYRWDAYSNGWDGTYKGRKQDMGVYVWELTYEDNTGQIRKKSGNVTLIK